MNIRAKTIRGKGIFITTQKVDQDDPLLGFFIRWIKEFSYHFDRVTVVCLEEGVYELPENIKVYSLGKLRMAGHQRFIARLRARASYFFRLLTIAWHTRKDYDYVFVHMNPEYIVSCGLLWRILGKTIALWYTHKQVDGKLRIAEKLTHLVFTASVESFRLSSSKVRVVGHGIDTDYFKPEDSVRARMSNVTHNLEQRHVQENCFLETKTWASAPERSLKSNFPGHAYNTREHLWSNSWKLISIARISSAKGGEVLLRGLAALREKGVPATLSFIGEPAVTGDQEYLQSLKILTQDLNLDDAVRFIGAIPHHEIPALLRDAAVYVNASKTGSVDKGVLEAMSCGILVVTSNEAFAPFLPQELIFPGGDHRVLSDRLFHLYSMDEKERVHLAERLRNIVVEGHSLESLIGVISAMIKGNQT